MSSAATRDLSAQHLLDRISSLELLISYTARATTSGEPGLDIPTVQAQLRPASKTSARSTAVPAPLVSLLERFKTLNDVFSRLKDDHPDIQLLVQNQAAHPAVFAPAVAAPLPPATLESLLAESAEDVTATAAELERLSALTPLLDAPLLPPLSGDLASLQRDIAAAEVAVAALTATAADADARVAEIARTYGAAVHSVSAQLLAWSAELDRLEEIVDRIAAADA